MKAPMKEGLWGETFARRYVAEESNRKEGPLAVEVLLHNRHAPQRKKMIIACGIAGGDFLKLFNSPMQVTL